MEKYNTKNFLSYPKRSKRNEGERYLAISHFRLLRFMAFVATCLVLSGCFGRSSSSGGPRCVNYFKPIYLSYEAFRSGVKWADPKPIEANGKIVTYNDYLLVIEPDAGIHFFDNINPEAPVGLGFLEVPGARDMLVHNDILHAQSYVDLVSVDMSDLDNVHEVSRTEFAFYSSRYDRVYTEAHKRRAMELLQTHFSDGIVIGYESQLTNSCDE